MNPIVTVLQAVLNLLGSMLPDTWRGVALLVAGLIGNLKLPAGDPRTNDVAKVVADLIGDIEKGLVLTDGNAAMAARLAAENKALKALHNLAGGRL